MNKVIADLGRSARVEFSMVIAQPVFPSAGIGQKINGVSFYKKSIYEK